MLHFELGLHAHQERLRDAERRWSILRALRPEPRPSRPLRARLGESLIRLGLRVAGGGVGSPALSG